MRSQIFSSHHVGELLKKCNGTKEKGVPAISLLCYRLGNVFADRSMYMQMRTGSFKRDAIRQKKLLDAIAQSGRSYEEIMQYLRSKSGEE